MRCTPAGAVNARAQPVAEMQAAWYHWRLRTRRRHSRLGGCRAALDAIGFGPRRARRFGRVSDKPLSAPSWPTCTMSGRPATVAISPKHLWRCSSPTAIMLSSPQSAAASRHRRTRRRSPPLHGTLPSGLECCRHRPTGIVMYVQHVAPFSGYNLDQSRSVADVRFSRHGAAAMQCPESDGARHRVGPLVTAPPTTWR